MVRRFLERGGLWVAIQFALMLAVLAAGIFWPGIDAGVLSRAFGWIMICLGGAVGLAGVWVLGRNRTPFPKPHDESILIQSGIYRFIRHPLYTSLCLLAVGWSALRGSGASGVVGVIMVVFLDFKSRREEQWLRAKFPEYERYQQRVKRFLPGVY